MIIIITLINWTSKKPNGLKESLGLISKGMQISKRTILLITIYCQLNWELNMLISYARWQYTGQPLHSLRKIIGVYGNWPDFGTALYNLTFHLYNNDKLVKTSLTSSCSECRGRQTHLPNILISRNTAIIKENSMRCLKLIFYSIIKVKEYLSYFTNLQNHQSNLLICIGVNY